MKLEEGKWYKWYQKNHNNTHIGKFSSESDTSVVRMRPWIVQTTAYTVGGCFERKYMEDIVEITDLTEISKLLPDGHVDKVAPKSETFEKIYTDLTELSDEDRNIVKTFYDNISGNNSCSVSHDYIYKYDHDKVSFTNDSSIESSLKMWEITKHVSFEEIKKELRIAPKSERYIATMKFFNELKEPEKSEAIENYDENLYGIPSNLDEALLDGFNWEKSKQGYKYWNDISDSIINNTYLKETLVFGKYKIGDIVVSLTDFKPRCAGGIYKVLKRSDDNVLFYLSTTNSSDADNWRLAIPEEVEAYHNGIKNINDIVKKGDWIVLLKPIQGFDVGKLYLVTDMSGDRLWKIQGINCQIDREYYRKATKEECIINNNRILNLNIKPKDYKEAVNCTTQEEWDFVLSKFNPRGLTTNNFSNNSNNKYIITVSSNSEYVGCHSSENYLVTNNYTILTFKEWCDKYGHTYVKEEPTSLEGRYIKCLKKNNWNDGKTKVGDILKIRKSDSVGDLFIGLECLDNSRLKNGEFELLPIDYTPEPVKEEQTMFKKGDYIVTLVNDGDCGKVNYCIKQNQDNKDLYPEIDTKNIKGNGSTTFTFSDKSGLKWRFATKEEGEEYERQGKPYNVTNLLSSLILNDSSGLITRDVSILSTSTFYGNTPHSYPLTPKEAYPNYSLPVPTNIILKTKIKSKSIKL